ncbi:MAG: hypothetical protein HY865_09030 [Chloroflexi bacterium]|nr:hypothetical protein [Chloroflexota bacterium]
MKQFWKSTASILFYVIAGALLIYAASRSLDFITATLPPDQRIIGYLGLAATSGGMLAWLMLFMFKAEGIGQKVTAGIMTVLDMLGEFALFTMDTLYQSANSGMIEKLQADEIRLVLLGLSALIAVNILATVAFHLLDPETIKHMRESFVRDHLEDQALKEIERRGEEIAVRLAPQIAEQWAKQFEARFQDMQSLGLGQHTRPQEAPAQAGPTPTRPQGPAQTAHEVQEVDIAHVPLSGFSGNGHR